MKNITKVITAIAGVVASLFSVACERQTPKINEAAQTEVQPQVSDTVEKQDFPQRNDEITDFPQTNDEEVGDIYGPPSMFTGNSEDDDVLNDTSETSEVPADGADNASDGQVEPLPNREEIMAPIMALYGVPSVNPGVLEQPVPSDQGIVAAPVYGMNPVPSPKPDAGNKNGNADEDDSDEIIQEYKKAAKPKRPPIMVKYGVPSRMKVKNSTE